MNIENFIQTAVAPYGQEVVDSFRNNVSQLRLAEEQPESVLNYLLVKSIQHGDSPFTNRTISVPVSLRHFYGEKRQRALF